MASLTYSGFGSHEQRAYPIIDCNNLEIIKEKFLSISLLVTSVKRKAFTSLIPPFKYMRKTDWQREPKRQFQ